MSLTNNEELLELYLLASKTELEANDGKPYDLTKAVNDQNWLVTNYHEALIDINQTEVFTSVPLVLGDTKELIGYSMLNDEGFYDKFELEELFILYNSLERDLMLQNVKIKENNIIHENIEGQLDVMLLRLTHADNQDCPEVFAVGWKKPLNTEHDNNCITTEAYSYYFHPVYGTYLRVGSGSVDIDMKTNQFTGYTHFAYHPDTGTIEDFRMTFASAEIEPLCDAFGNEEITEYTYIDAFHFSGHHLELIRDSIKVFHKPEILESVELSKHVRRRLDR